MVWTCDTAPIEYSSVPLMMLPLIFGLSLMQLYQVLWLCDMISFNASLTCTFPPIQTIHLVAAVAQCVNPAFTNKPLLPSQLFTCGGVIVLLFVATHIRKPCNKWNSTIVASACRAGPLFFSDWINYIVHISFNHQLAQKQSCQFKGFKFDKMGQTFYY